MFLKICLFLYEIHRPFPSDCEDCEMRCKFVTFSYKPHIIKNESAYYYYYKCNRPSNRQQMNRGAKVSPCQTISWSVYQQVASKQV